MAVPRTNRSRADDDGCSAGELAPPFYRPSEEVMIGPYAHNKRFVGQVGIVVNELEPIHGECRYAVLVRGRREIFLQVTLRKIHKGGNWDDCVWQPVSL